MKIFLVEDNEELNGFMTETLRNIGYNVVSCKDGANAFKLVEDIFDLYIIDINLPNINGLELVKKIKSLKGNLKIFIISGDDNIETILKAYDLGCDDYIKKPFDLREIVAKINIVFKDKLTNQVKLTDDCYYDIKKRVVNYKEKNVTLTKKESALLNVLVKNIGKSVTNEEIELAVWGKNFENSHVRQLVSKLKKVLPCKDIIQNHSSLGYRIDSL
jgi:DNA-binding response OmpR family regulator